MVAPLDDNSLTDTEIVYSSEDTERAAKRQKTYDKHEYRTLKNQAHHSYRCGDFKKAAALYQRVFALNPHATDALYEYGRMQQKLGDDEAAISILGDVVAQHPSHTRAMCKIAEILISRKSIAAAEVQYQRAIEANSHCSVAWEYFGEKALHAGDFHEAVLCFSNAAKGDTLQPTSRQNLARSHQMLGQFKEALKAILKAREIDPESPAIYFQMGEIYAELKEPVKAFQSFATCLSYNPEYAGAFEKMTELKATKQ